MSTDVDMKIMSNRSEGIVLLKFKCEQFLEKEADQAGAESTPTPETPSRAKIDGLEQHTTCVYKVVSILAG